MKQAVLNMIVWSLAIVGSSAAHAQIETIPADVPARSAAKVYLPANYAERGNWPVILLLHGYEENQAFISKYFFGSDEQILKGTRFILVVPEGLPENSPNKYHYWNASDACCDFGASKVDDVKYLTDLVDQVAAKYKVDKRRVYATGHSNGAFMSHRLACASADHFAAIAPFAGMTSLNIENCQPTSPVSLLQINALDDDTIKFAGDKGFTPLLPYPGANESALRWASFDHCDPTPVDGPNASITENFRFGQPDAKTRSWKGCTPGTDVVQYQIQPYSGLWYHAHTPLLSWNFTETVVSFLLLHTKQN